jgi:diguanylate cyclase (GGDEF)-like protein
MNERFRLPRPQIATKFYGAIALILAVVYVLAAAATQFAVRTEEVTRQFQHDDYSALLQYGSLEVALEQQRRLVATALLSDRRSREEAESAFGDLTAQISELLARLGNLADSGHINRYDDLAQQGAMALAFARDERTSQASIMAADYDKSARAFQSRIAADRRQRAEAGAVVLHGIAADSRSLIAWVCAVAAISGLVIGPIGLLLLGRVLSRLQRVGNALIRLARNDTSVDIPGLASEDEVGRLARSVAVFKAKSIELMQRKAESQRLNLQLDAAINNMPLGLSMFDAQERLLVCNRRYMDMYELPSELARPGTARCALWDHRERRGARHYPMDGDGTHGWGDGDAMTIEFGSERIIAVSRQPLKGGGWLALHEDVTQRRRQEREISHLARHDVLTNLANRALFREQLQAALLRLRQGQGFAVFCLDLDRFKAVNDTLGHPVGDILLKVVSERLLSCVRQGDLVARLGGDEFAIIQANVRDPESSEVLAARIVETIAKHYQINGHTIDISTSIGITMAPRDGSDADQLLKNADLALYRTKADGRNGFSFFKPEMDAHVQVRRQLENDLREAIEKDTLALSFQPAVCLQTRTVTGFESLMRWIHPQRGTIQPADFIALAEEANLVSELGGWALKRACAEAARWSSPRRVSINLSPLQIKRDLIEVVLHALADSGLSPHRLELEITEAVLMQDSQNTLATLHQLRQLGVGLVMDNFGRGYCSLSYLRSFPFDKIKIDRALIADLDRSATTRALVEAIIGLGNSLGMVTVAEGVENYAQLEMVRGFACNEAQGFYFSSAVASGGVERVLQDGFEHARDAA